MGRKDRAVHGSEHWAGPVGEWHRGDNWRTQHTLGVGTDRAGIAVLLPAGSGVSLATGGARGKSHSPQKSLPEFLLSFLHFTVQWQFHTLGIWLQISGEELGETRCFPWPAVGA